jgi:hypothetical protein
MAIKRAVVRRFGTRRDSFVGWDVGFQNAPPHMVRRRDGRKSAQ